MTGKVVAVGFIVSFLEAVIIITPFLLGYSLLTEKNNVLILALLSAFSFLILPSILKRTGISKMLFNWVYKSFFSE